MNTLLIALLRGLMLPIIGLIVFPLFWVVFALACYLSHRNANHTQVVTARPDDIRHPKA